jgi:uncharacterized membrane protein YbhN (UPF0104 family)
MADHAATGGRWALESRAGEPPESGAVGRLRRHPIALAAVALAIAAGVIVAIAASVGFATFGDVLASVRPGWIVLAAAAQPVGAIAYTFSYRVLASLDAGPKIPFTSTLRLVAAGFGAFTVAGGFTLDYQVWKQTTHTGRRARVRVLGLGTVEYVVLAPAACISAIVLLADGSRIMPSLLWPWAVAVPLGFAAAFWASAKRAKLSKDGRRRRLDETLRAIEVMRRLVTVPPICVETLLGMALYWAAEIVSLWAALRAFGANLGTPELIVAYATGYAATRRTLPLGGAGTTEALLTYALHWVGLAVAPALAAVVVYRFFNFTVVTFPALHARRQLEPLFRGDGGEQPARELERLLA